MQCTEEYLFDRDKQLGRCLREILLEDYCFELGGEERTPFEIKKGFLWYGRYKVIKIDGDWAYLHGYKLFVAKDRLRVYELPLGQSRSLGDLIVKEGSMVLAERDGKRWNLAAICEEKVLDVAFSKDKAWIWYSEGEEEEYLCKSIYLLKDSEWVKWKKETYRESGEEILRIQDIVVRKKTVVRNPLRVWSKVLMNEVVSIVVTEDMVYVECGGYISLKPCCGGIYDMDGCRLLGLSSWENISDLYLTLLLFTDIAVENLELERIEEYLFKLFVFTEEGERLVKWLMESGMDEKKEMIVCKLYRKIDDRGKRKIEGWVRRVKNLDALKLVIIYFPEEMERYIRMCIEEKREYEIEEVIEHYRGSEMMKEISRVLLQNNCFYLFSQCMPEYEGSFGDVVLVEKYNMESQKNIRLERDRKI
ncbi:uncharacterized protein Eint_071080 [Encephalitozoon intestinalis ATCC 50506]|uniref:Uncharacterized protein n=1 Tax=Encephalitozoon intestinalis (strain ATCC 50506) TaxID=876142 RepID=E0S836_ENCIT|nr:uncharacterized protein Eint_071080 [Encephalitozoon intestinalis ATCC 50506]ADM11871.1 hypothetical protein Eint_071080 [Encephalitozoon intestinalis ATCC 50506]UTX45627.1 hypothetical protein GPK93_07g11920 [Encephalitozoon intestinalis]